MSKETQAAYRKRMAKAGYRQVATWVHKDDLERVKAYLARLRKARS